MKGNQWMVLILVYMKVMAIFLFAFSCIHFGGITGRVDVFQLFVILSIIPLLLAGFYLDWSLWKQAGRDRHD